MFKKIVKKLQQITNKIFNIASSPCENANQNSRKEILIHIGFPKTGSTALQFTLRNNFEHLKQNGVLFLDEGYELGGYLAKNSPLSEVDLLNLKNKWNSEVTNNNSQRIVLSSEGFYGSFYEPWLNSIDVASDVAKIFEGNNLKIIAVLRSLPEKYESLYQQYIKEGRSESFGKFKEMYNPFKFDFFEILKPFIDCFGSSNIYLFNYSKMITDDVGFTNKFFERLNIPVTFTKTETIYNPSLTKEGLELARLVNPILSDDKKNLFRNFLQQAFPKQDREAIMLFERYEYDELKAFYDCSIAKLKNVGCVFLN
jgi:hypothetical protein